MDSTQDYLTTSKEYIERLNKRIENDYNNNEEFRQILIQYRDKAIADREVFLKNIEETEAKKQEENAKLQEETKPVEVNLKNASSLEEKVDNKNNPKDELSDNEQNNFFNLFKNFTDTKKGDYIIEHPKYLEQWSQDEHDAFELDKKSRAKKYLSDSSFDKKFDKKLEDVIQTKPFLDKLEQKGFVKKEPNFLTSNKSNIFEQNESNLNKFNNGFTDYNVNKNNYNISQREQTQNLIDKILSK